MLYILLASVLLIIILAIFANISKNMYNQMYENFSIISSIGKIRDKIKLHRAPNAITSTKPIKGRQEITDVQDLEPDVVYYTD